MFKPHKSLISIALALFNALFIAPVLSATTYYVSSLHGNNANNGTSAAAPWADFTTVNITLFSPGDRILLERGSVWNNTILSPYGSGSAAAPIIIDSYGPGTARPVINAAGYLSTTTHGASSFTPVPSGDAYGSGAVTLFNQEYWEINNLELTNKLSSTFDPTLAANNFSGIRVWAKGAGTLEHIYIRGNYIHDVTGEVSWGGDNVEGKRTGGIVVFTWGGSSQSPATSFDDVRIENNTITNVSMEGICVQQSNDTVNNYINRSSYSGRSSPAWVPYTNVIIDGNSVNNQSNPMSNQPSAYSSDPIQIIGVQGGHIYNNLIQGGGTVGIETDYSDQILIEYNEVSGIHQHYVDGGGIDHAGIDLDAETSNTVVQYNYSHDNGEGIILDTYTFAYNNVVRFNLVVNNDVGNEGSGATAIPGDAMRSSSANGNTYIYNNTIFDSGSTLNLFTVNQPPGSNLAYYYIDNNLFYGGKANWPGGTQIIPNYSHNGYYGLTAASGDSYAVTGNPLLLNSGGTDNGTVPGAMPLSTIGYRVSSGSPEKYAGTTPSLPGGSPAPPSITTDFFHNTFGGSLSIGADCSGGGMPGHITLPIQASNYNTNSGTDADGQLWSLDTSYVGWTGIGGELAGPGTTYNEAPGSAAQLGYRIIFPGGSTGSPVNYYTWVRGWAPNGSANSMSLGLNGTFTSTGTNIFYPVTASAWQWTNQYYVSPGVTANALLQVTSSVAQHVYAAIAKDQFEFDRIVLSSDPNYLPTIWAGSYNSSTSSTGCIEDASGYTWMLDTTYAGYYNTGAMYAGPATVGACTTVSVPVLHYTVNFPAAGTWYVWAHAYSAGTSTGSVSFAIDGGTDTAVQMPATGSYVWANGTVASGGLSPIAITVSSAGSHDVAMFMKQQGVRVDQIFLTTDSNSYPRSN